jgi:hypothetical protein
MREDKLTNGRHVMLVVLRATRSQQVGQTHLGGPPTTCLSRALLRENLIHTGWIPEHAQIKMDRSRLRAALRWCTLTAPKRLGIVGFNGEWVWMG